MLFICYLENQYTSATKQELSIMMKSAQANTTHISFNPFNPKVFTCILLLRPP